MNCNKMESVDYDSEDLEAFGSDASEAVKNLQAAADAKCNILRARDHAEPCSKGKDCIGDRKCLDYGVSEGILRHHYQVVTTGLGGAKEYKATCGGRLFCYCVCDTTGLD